MALRAYAGASQGLAVIAPLDIVFDEFDVVQPDIVFFRAERRHLVNLDLVTRHRPDIAVEVLSPSATETDRDTKMRMFLRYGAPEYWIVDPVLEQIEVHALGGRVYRPAQVAGAGDTVRSVLLPDLAFEVDPVFGALT